MYVGELINRNNSSVSHRFFPSHKFMGCKKGSESMKELDGYERNMRVDLSTDKRDIIRIGIDDENDDNDDDEFLSVTGIQAPLLKNRSLTNITLSNDTSSRASNAVLERACTIVMHVRRCGVLIAMWNVLFMLAMLLIIP